MKILKIHVELQHCLEGYKQKTNFLEYQHVEKIFWIISFLMTVDGQGGEVLNKSG